MLEGDEDESTVGKSDGNKLGIVVGFDDDEIEGECEPKFDGVDV